MFGIVAVVPCGCVVGASLLGMFAIVLCGCIAVASLLGMFAIVLCGCIAVAGSVIFDTNTLLLSSLGLGAHSESSTEKRETKAQYD